MMKKTILLAVALSGMMASQFAAAGTVRIYNNDSKTHTIKLSCAGSSKTLSVSASSTSSYSFNQNSCTITGGSVDFSAAKLEDGQSWKIRNSKAKKN